MLAGSNGLDLMRDEINKYKIFTRRALILNGVKILLCSTLLSRYFYLQIIKSGKYSALSDKNRVKLMVVSAQRGIIYDINDLELANTVKRFRLVMAPYEAKNFPRIQKEIEKILGRKLKFTEESFKKTLRKRFKNEDIILEDNLGWEDIILISEKNYLIPEVSIVESSVRFYPYGEALAHVLGYVAIPNEEEINSLTVPMFNDLKIGKAGIEKAYDDYLRGAPGFKKVEVNVYGQFVRQLSDQSSVSGSDLHLTIDGELQKFIHKLLTYKNINASVVVMEVETGHILSLYSSPTFDPNQFVEGISKDYWDTLNSNVHRPLTNHAIADIFPPGSTFKLITALAGLDYGINPQDKFFCSGNFKVGNHTFRCWNHQGHGNLNMEQAIAQSCNPYFYNIGQIVGINKLTEIARKLGYGAKTNVELPSEQAGLMPDPVWKQMMKRGPWYKGDTINASIGHGDVLVTPIQLAQLACRIASGKQVFPTLLKNNRKEFLNLEIQEKHLNTVRQGMYDAVNEPIGIAYRHNLKAEGIIFAGKTGTAQVAAMKFKNKNEFLRHHALYTSFSPIDKPKYAVSVIVKHGEAGSKTAVPIAKQIYLKLNNRRGELEVDIDAQYESEIE